MVAGFNPAKGTQLYEDCNIKYIVTIPYACFVSVDKLIGVSASNVSIEAGDIPLEVDGFSIEVYKAS